MVTITQNWVGYADRSYEQIKRSCLRRLGIQAPEISDHSESNPLIIILSMFAGIGEMLNLYIDAAAREVYLGTARRYKSAVKIVKLIDYLIRAKNPASVNLYFELTDSNGTPAPLPVGTVIIPQGTIINSSNSNIPFVLQSDVYINTGYQNAYGVAKQQLLVIAEAIGSTDGSPYQRIDLSDDYVDGSIRLVIGSDEWKPFKSLGIMFPSTLGFTVNIDEDSKAYIEFGDGVNGKIPTNGQVVYADYRVSTGYNGNVPPDQITELTVQPALPDGISIRVTNPDYASGGSNFETLREIQNRAPRSIRTLERAVTYQDYIDLCYLVLGVGAAAVNYCCGKFVDIYIAPNSPGNATLALLQDVRDFINCRKMITTQISVQASGISKIWIKAKIYGKPLEYSRDIYNQVVNELDLKYGYGTLQINGKISIPGIISTVENLSKVDRIEVEQVRLLPYARPIDNTPSILNIVFITLPITTVNTKYTIIHRATLNQFEIYKSGIFLDIYNPDQVYADSIVSFKVQAGTYTDGDKWEFTAYTSYPEIFPISLIEIKDFSAPIIDVGPFIDSNTPRTIFSELTIIEQGSSTSCQAPCN
jgi:hypothetical protein